MVLEQRPADHLEESASELINEILMLLLLVQVRLVLCGAFENSHEDVGEELHRVLVHIVDVDQFSQDEEEAGDAESDWLVFLSQDVNALHLLFHLSQQDFDSRDSLLRLVEGCLQLGVLKDVIAGVGNLSEDSILKIDHSPITVSLLSDTLLTLSSLGRSLNLYDFRCDLVEQTIRGDHKVHHGYLDTNFRTVMWP